LTEPEVYLAHSPHPVSYGEFYGTWRLQVLCGSN
jgi:hypothetical protein